MKYLGHIISIEEVETNPKKIEAMRNWPIPHLVKELGGFLVLSGLQETHMKIQGDQQVTH